MNPRLLWTAAALALLSANAIAQSCNINPSQIDPVGVQLRNASVVFQGRAVAVTDTADGPAILFQPTRWWKGARPGYVWVYTAKGSCGLAAQRGQDWVVIAKGDPAYTDVTMRNAPVVTQQDAGPLANVIRESGYKEIKAEGINRGWNSVAMGVICGPNGLPALGIRFAQNQSSPYPTLSLVFENVDLLPNKDYFVWDTNPKNGKPYGKVAFCTTQELCVEMPEATLRVDHAEGEDIAGSLWLSANHPERKQLRYKFSGTAAGAAMCESTKAAALPPPRPAK